MRQLVGCDGSSLKSLADRRDLRVGGRMGHIVDAYAATAAIIRVRAPSIADRARERQRMVIGMLRVPHIGKPRSALSDRLILDDLHARRPRLTHTIRHRSREAEDAALCGGACRS